MPLAYLSDRFALKDQWVWETQQPAIALWLLLALAPRWAWTHRLCKLAFVLWAGIYVTSLAHVLMTSGEQLFSTPGGPFSLAAVTKLMANSDAVIPCWFHYIVLDLVGGIWISSDAASKGIPRLLVAPCLFFTLMAGPVGIAMYVLLLSPWFSVKVKTD